MISRSLLLLLLGLLSACGGSAGQPEAVKDVLPPDDQGDGDSGSQDSGAQDSGAQDSGSNDQGVLPNCSGQYGPPQSGAVPAYEKLIEASGIAPSRSRSDLLWLHNDSGDDPIIYGIGVDGRKRGKVRLGVDATDWEDIATARCPGGQGHCIWVGDIGDNTLTRTQVTVLAVEEPDGDGDQSPSRIWRFPVRYPDAPHDSEALLVAPSGDKFWLLEKIDGPEVRMFGHGGPLIHDQVTVLEEVIRFNAPGVPIDRGQMVTAADLHPNGRQLLIRVYTGTYEYVLPRPLSMGDLGTVEPRIVAFGPLSERQGEAVSYDESGQGIWTIAEDPLGLSVQPLHHYACEP